MDRNQAAALLALIRLADEVGVPLRLRDAQALFALLPRIEATARGQMVCMFETPEPPPAAPEPAMEQARLAKSKRARLKTKVP